VLLLILPMRIKKAGNITFWQVSCFVENLPPFVIRREAVSLIRDS
jgi:hypothetical protein